MLLRMTDIVNRGAATSRVLEVAEAVSPVEAGEAVTRGSLLRWVPPPCPSSSRIWSGRALARPPAVTSPARPVTSEAAVGDHETSRNPRCCCPSTAVQSSRHSATSRYGCFPGPVLCGGVRKGQDGARAVTGRGEVLGLLEMSLPGEPHLDTLSEIARTAHLLGFVVIANCRRHRPLSSGDSEAHRSPCPPRSTSVAALAIPARAARLLCRRGWSPLRTSVATPSTTASAATCCTCQSRMRVVTAWLAR